MCQVFTDNSFPFASGSFRLKWSNFQKGSRVAISDFHKTSLICAVMFEKVALKISVFEEIEVKGMRHRAHIFIHESKKCDPQFF